MSIPNPAKFFLLEEPTDEQIRERQASIAKILAEPDDSDHLRLRVAANLRIEATDQRQTLDAPCSGVTLTPGLRP